MTNDELMQLREDITLGSVYLKDYRNRFGIDTDTVYTFFEGYLDYLVELIEYDIPNYADARFYDYLPDYDNADTHENWYSMFEYDPLPLPVFLQEIVFLHDWEDIPDDDYKAIQYMQNWDYGSNYADNITLDDVKHWHGTVAIRGEYVLFRSRVDGATLYRICA